MKVKWGAFIVDGRNKVGGHVASKNRSGAYIRTKVTPANPQSSAQLLVRQRFTTNSQAWRGLTTTQRDAWAAAVTNFLSTDIFGDTVTPSGFNLYIQLNNNLLTVGQPVIVDPPLPESVQGFTAFDLTADTSGAGFDIAFAPAIAANVQVILWATPPLSPGKNFVKSQYRLISILDDTDLTPHDAQAAYIAKYGALPAIGTKVFAKFKPINEDTGQAGSEISDSDIAS